jgi:hypothetical protein
MKALMMLGVVALLNVTGCDSSKEELESTKTSLANVTKERDTLKTQVTTLQQQFDATKAELTKAQAAAAPKAAPAEAKPAETKTTAAPAKAKHKS